MMPEWLYYLIAFAVFLGAMVALTRYQTGKYQAYLTRHNETSEAVLVEQRRTQAAIERQTQALERIALAIERRDT